MGARLPRAFHRGDTRLSLALDDYIAASFTTIRCSAHCPSASRHAP